MSEPSSLYARVRLSEAALATFQASTPPLPRHYTDWLPWLANKHFYGTISQATIDQLRYDINAPVGDILRSWLNQPFESFGRSTYDPETQTWTYALLDASENYKEYILILSLLRGVAQYKDLPGEDFILIYPYIWGDLPNAYVVVNAGSSHFVTEIPQVVIIEADAGLQLVKDAMQSAYSNEET